MAPMHHMISRRKFVTGGAALAAYAALPAHGRLAVTNLGGFGGGDSGKALIDIIISLRLDDDLQLCLDAGDADSYTSGQKWLDVSGNGYDFTLGASDSAEGTDPTFNGTAGGLTSNEYFEYDGGDFFEYDTTPEAWMNTLHKDGAVFTIIHWFYKVEEPNIRVHVGTQKPSGTGMTFEHSAGDGMSVVAFDDAGLATVLDVSVDPAFNLSEPAWHFVAVSLDEPAGAGGSFFYINGDYAQVSSSNTFDATYSSPSTNGSNEMQIGADGKGNLPFAFGTRSAELAIWQGTALTKTNLDSIYSRTKGRFGL